MSDDNEILYFNGLNGDTGKYLFDPTTAEEVARRAGGEEDPARASGWLSGILKRLKGPFQGLPMEVDPNDIAQAGWGIVFAKDVGPDVREALEPLIQHRRSQVPEDRCKVLEYDSGKGLKEWLKGYGVHIGAVAPAKVPYYLLLIGSPTQIPFSFQCWLDIEYAVGRLHFDKAEDYHNYATSVIRYDTEPTVPSAREVAYWGVKHDRATELSADYLISPLYNGAQDARAIAEVWDFESRCLLAEDATRSNLLQLFERRPPSVLCTASHGLGWKMDQVDRQRQLAENGALCSQDWTGEGPLTMDHYITAQDFGDDLNVHGMVAFLFACFGAGTPDKNHFLRAGAEPETIAEEPFVSAIPKKLLGHPKGGALAVLGHVDMAWSYSFKPPKIDEQIQPFRNLIGRILKGQPVGNATTDFSERYAALSAELLSQHDRSQKPPDIPPKKLARMWIERNDAQNYIMLGDPATRVRVDRFRESDSEMAKPEKTTTPATCDHSAPVDVGASQQEATNVPTAAAPIRAAEGPSDTPVKEFAAPPQPSTTTAQAGAVFPANSASDAMLFFLGKLRALRAQAQTLLGELERITDVDLRLKGADEQISQVICGVNVVWSECRSQVQGHRDALITISQQDPLICDWCSDDVARLEIRWATVAREWPGGTESQAELQVIAAQLQTVLHDVVRLCGQLTIPRRVNDHLASLRIGQAFDFHKAFQDELPNQADRVNVLQFMADHPNIVTGIVDSDAGIIYRASPSHRRRLFSYLGVILLAAIGFGLIWCIDQTKIWTADTGAGSDLRFTELARAYAFLLFGAVAHVLVGAIKQTKQRASAGLVALEDWLLWCHVRETSLVLSIVYLWIGLAGMAFLFEPPLSWHTAFFVGYSVDSFVDIFLAKFSARAESDLASLRST